MIKSMTGFGRAEYSLSLIHISGDTAEAGDVIFKIIDNSQWYMVCWMSEEEASIFSEGSSVSVRPDGENEVEMTVYSLTAQDEERRVILSCNRFYEGCLLYTSFHRQAYDSCPAVFF